MTWPRHRPVGPGSLEVVFTKIIFNKLPGESVVHQGNETTVGM